MSESARLLKAARDALDNSYSPYSGLRIAAVIEDEAGNLYRGVNVENASYGLTICAERAAVFNAVTSGAGKFRRILVYSPDVMPFPCGACRQVLMEFCGEDFPVIVATDDSEEEHSLGELLPHHFNGDGGKG